MAAIVTDASGDNIFLALEDSSGNQLVAKAARSDLSTFTIVYEPGAGSACNVAMVPSEPDSIYFYGNFGTDVTVLKHTVSTGAESDISPASLGAKEVNTLAVNPSDADELVIGVDTDEDLKYSDDGGSSWSDWDATLGFDATALAVLWSGAYMQHRYFVAGDNATTLDILYSPNQGNNDTDVSGATVGALTNISALEVTEA